MMASYDPAPAARINTNLNGGKTERYGHPYDAAGQADVCEDAVVARERWDVVVGFGRTG
jgi:hypothetical protein